MVLEYSSGRLLAMPNLTLRRLSAHRGFTLLGAAAIAILGGWFVAAPGTTLGAASTSVVMGLSDNSSLTETVASPAGQGGSMATTVNCSVGAVGKPPIAHGIPENFPPSAAVPAGAIPQTEAGAVRVARATAAKFGGTPPAPVSAAVALREMSYADFLIMASWPANPTINPERCVWVVTVRAPIAVKDPPGTEPQTASVYSVALDVGSGRLVGLLVGTELLR